MPNLSTNCKPYTSAELLFWFWVLYHHAKQSADRLGTIKAAVQAEVMGFTLAADLKWAFHLEGE